MSIFLLIALLCVVTGGFGQIMRLEPVLQKYVKPTTVVLLSGVLMIGMYIKTVFVWGG